MPDKRCVASGNGWLCQKKAELRTATETITCAAQFSGGEPHNCGDFGAVAAELHAAPAAGGVFCGVVKMQDAAFALAHGTRIETGERRPHAAAARKDPRVSAVESGAPLQSSLENGEPHGQRVLG